MGDGVSTIPTALILVCYTSSAGSSPFFIHFCTPFCLWTPETLHLCPKLPDRTRFFSGGVRPTSTSVSVGTGGWSGVAQTLGR